MSTINGLPDLDALLRKRLPRVPRLGEIPSAFGGAFDFADAAGGLELPGGSGSRPPAGFPNSSSYPTGVNRGTFSSTFQQPSLFDSAAQPQGIERRGEHPRLRSLVDEGPDAIEAELRGFIQQAPAEDVAQNPRAWWQTALEWLDLPRNAVANLVNNVLGSPVKPSSKEEFAGLRKIYGADVLRTMGWRPDSTIGRVGQFVAGLMLDFVTDPLSWLTGLAGFGRGTLKTAATTADDLAREIAGAQRIGKGLSIGGQHVKPGALERLGELTRADEAFFPEIARAEGFPSAVERAAAQIPAEDLYKGRFGVGVETHAAKNLPLGHLVAGPLILGGKATGALVEGVGRAAGAIPKVGRVIGPPLELAGRVIQKPADLLGAVSDAIGTPLSRLPEAAAFKPFAEIPGTRKMVDLVDQALQAPAVQRAGEAVRTAAGKIGIGPGSALQQLVRRYVEQAERGKRYTEAEFREQVSPLIKDAAKQTGIAAEHLEPLYAMAAEFMPQIRAAADSGDPMRLRAVLDEQESLIKGHLRKWYSDAKIVKATDQVMEILGKRQRLGMPRALSSSVDSVGANATSSKPGPPAFQSPSDQVSTRPLPSANRTIRATADPTRAGGTKVFTVGDIEESTHEIITQPHAEIERLLSDAEVQRPRFDQVLADSIRGIPGARTVPARVKGRPRLDQKLQHRGPQAISDYLGGRIIVEKASDIAQVAENLSGRLLPGSVDWFLEAPKNDAGYRSVHVQIGLDNGMTAELQIVPAPIAAAQDRLHKTYKRWRGLDPERATASEMAQFSHDMANSRREFEAATNQFIEASGRKTMVAARERTERAPRWNTREPPKSRSVVVDLGLPGTTYGRHSLSYKHGITGSDTEAAKYADEAFTAQATDKVRKALGVPADADKTVAGLVFVPVPSTSGADNQVPLALAKKLAAELGGTVAPELLATGTYRSRRAKGRLESLANPRDFVASESYELPAGAQIVLVDDVAKTGGTLRDAAAALNESGYPVAASVVGRGRPRVIDPISPTRAAEIRTRAGKELPALEEALGRSIDSLTTPEAEALLGELAKPGTSGRSVAMKLERLREVPLPAGGRASKAIVSPAGRQAVEAKLVSVHDDLQRQGLIGDVLAEGAAINARTGDIEAPMAPGYVFTEAMTGEARELQNELRARGYGRLAGRVKVRKGGEKAVAGQTGDDALGAMTDAGERDPIARMADSIIGHEEETSGIGRVRRALAWIEQNPTIATPEQKDLARRHAALTSPERDVRKAARGKAGELVDAEKLAVGDRVSIAGEPHTVTKADETGVIVKDGEEIHLQPGEPLVVNRGSHEADPLDLAVTQAVGRLTAEGIRVNVASVLGTLREMLPAASRDAELKRLLGVTKLKGNRTQIDSRIEMSLLRSGEGIRGIKWDAILQRLEEIETGRPGRNLSKLEQSHSLGSFITQKTDPVTGALTQARTLTPLGRQALDAMRANLAAGGEPAQVGRLIERINVLESKFQMAKRSGQPTPRGVWQELSSKKDILGRMGRKLVDEKALQQARTAAEAKTAAERSLAAPTPRDLFAEPIAAVLEKLIELERKTQSEEAGKVAVGDIARNTERGIGYFPRVMGDARTVFGKQYRADAMRWTKAWEDVSKGMELLESGVRYGRTPYENLLAIVKAENKDRVAKGLPAIPEPAKDGDLAMSLAMVLDRYPDLKPGHRHQLARTFLRENMLHEINTLAEHTGVAFTTDPVKAWMQRRVASHYAVAGADFLQAIIANAVETGLAVPVKGRGQVPEGFERLVDKRFGAMAGGFAFSKDLVKEFKKFTRTMDQPHVILRGFDWATSQWRTMVLGVFPYTMTNLLSGVFQSNQFDAFSHKAWSAGKKLMEDLHLGRSVDTPMRKYIDGLPKDLGELTAKQFYDALSIEHGALGKGNYGVELEQAVVDNVRTEWGVADAVASSFSGANRREELLAGLAGVHRDDRGRLRWDLSEQAYFKAFRAANVAVEDWMKISFIIERLRKGDGLADAVQKGRLALNQSADLTDFERATFRRILPFWGWMKGNALLQLTMAVNRPQITALVGKIRGNLEASFAGDETLPASMRPRHVAEELGAQLSGGAKPDFINLTRVFPVKELGTTPLAAGNVIDSTLETLITGLNPLIKGPLEATINRDLYWDRPINEYEGQRRRWLGVDLPPGVKRVAQTIRPLNVIEQTSWRGVPTTAGEAGFTAAQTLGLRTFPVDVQRQVFEREREINTQLAAVMRDFSRARMRAEQRGGDWRRDPEVQRIRGIYADLRADRDRLPLKEIRGLTADSRRAYRQRREELRDFALAG